MGWFRGVSTQRKGRGRHDATVAESAAIAEPKDEPFLRVEAPNVAYRVGQRVGGDMTGTLLAATERETDSSHVIKLLRPDTPAAVMLREIDVARRHKSPQMLSVSECGVHRGQLWYALAVPAGAVTLDRLLHHWGDQGRLPLRVTYEILCDVAAALHALNDSGLGHGGLHGDAVFVVRSRERRARRHVHAYVSAAQGPPVDRIAGPRDSSADGDALWGLVSRMLRESRRWDTWTAMGVTHLLGADHRRLHPAWEALRKVSSCGEGARVRGALAVLGSCAEAFVDEPDSLESFMGLLREAAEGRPSSGVEDGARGVA